MSFVAHIARVHYVQPCCAFQLSAINCIITEALHAVQILGQAKDPAVIQAHLKKLFAGVHQVALTDSKDAITAAMSIESEQVQLATAVPVSEQVEGWLQSLLMGMQTTLQVHIPAHPCISLHTCFCRTMPGGLMSVLHQACFKCSATPQYSLPDGIQQTNLSST